MGEGGSGGAGTPLGMCRGWMKAMENRCSQRHLAGSLLRHLQAMWPHAAWPGSDPRLSTPHELAVVTSIHSRGQHMHDLRNSNSFRDSGASLKCAPPTKLPLAGLLFP